MLPGFDPDQFRPDSQRHHQRSDERIAALALALTPGLGITLITRLLDRFGSAIAVIEADLLQIQGIRGIGSMVAAAIKTTDFTALHEQTRLWSDDRIRCVMWSDPDYPPPLTALPDRPAVLFWRGSLPPNAGYSPSAAIVGTRRPTPRGRELAESTARQLALQGVTIVSGLAYGIDIAAHQGARRGKDGKTVAILGSGLNAIYPPEHQKYAAMFERNGATLSEVHPDETVSRAGLVMRNRLIAAFADQVIVIESDVNGGAMHCARRALSLDKPVYAWPEGGSGCRYLLENGAMPLSQGT